MGLSGTFITNADDDPIGGTINLELGVGRTRAQGNQADTGKYSSDYFDTGNSCGPRIQRIRFWCFI